MIPRVTDYRRDVPAGVEHRILPGSDQTLCGELVAFDDHPGTPGEPEPGFDLCPECEAVYARLHTPEGRPAAG
jgi:hypothetical protein